MNIEHQDVKTVNLTEEELIELTNKNRSLIVDLCNTMLRNDINGKGRITFEDELGVDNNGYITRREDNITIFWFVSADYNRKVRREVTVTYRQPVKNNLLDNSSNIKSFEITYRDKERYFIGKNEAKYYCDGKTISYAHYEYYDEFKKEETSGHLDKSYEKLFIQGILQNRIQAHTNDKCDENLQNLKK